MFYVKEQLNDAMEVSVEINDENVYCRCPQVRMRGSGGSGGGVRRW